MSDPFVAEIRMFGFNFAPTGWAQCNGQLLPISQNTALFSLLGTFYGGDGKSTFALAEPAGIGRHPSGPGPGLQEWFLGQLQGEDAVTLLINRDAGPQSHPGRDDHGRHDQRSRRNNQLGKGHSGNPVSGVTQARIYSTVAPQTAMAFQGDLDCRLQLAAQQYDALSRR